MSPTERRLRNAIVRLVETHGAPNVFYLQELHAAGGPSPLQAGRVADNVHSVRDSDGAWVKVSYRHDYQPKAVEVLWMHGQKGT
jgi:hypothetical protein